MSEMYNSTPNRIDCGIEAFWPDPINPHNDYSYDGLYTINRWKQSRENRFPYLRFQNRLLTTSMKRLCLLDGDGRVVVGGNTHA